MAEIHFHLCSAVSSSINSPWSEITVGTRLKDTLSLPLLLEQSTIKHKTIFAFWVEENTTKNERIPQQTRCFSTGTHIFLYGVVVAHEMLYTNMADSNSCYPCGHVGEKTLLTYICCYKESHRPITQPGAPD